MCIILVQPPEVEIPEDHLKNSYSYNEDGIGYMFCTKKGELRIRKGFNDYNSFLLKYYEDWLENSHSHFVLHFRISTSGEIDRSNCHPFSCHKHNAGFCHNGILTHWTSATSKHSDTRRFLYNVLDRMPTGFLDNRGICRLLNQYAFETSSKFVFLLPEENSVIIMNESSGSWDSGVWYSNSTYQWLYSSNYSIQHYVPKSGYETINKFDTQKTGNLVYDFCEHCQDWYKSYELEICHGLKLCESCIQQLHPSLYGSKQQDY
jgi:predicted glutamine amidotransferase